MHEYRVVERLAEEGLCAFQCSTGRYHVARALRVMPPMEASLIGDKPRLGFGVLQCNSSGAFFRVIFESINETQPAPPSASVQPAAMARQASV